MNENAPSAVTDSANDTEFLPYTEKIEISNLEDLARWDQALEEHALLSEAEMKPALTPVHGAAYGFGWFLDPHAGRARMWHSGSTQGFSTVIERFTAEKLTIVVLCNRTDLDASTRALQVADLFSPTSVPTARPAAAQSTGTGRAAPRLAP